VVFKRRDKRSYVKIARDFVYPKGGFRRAVQYVLHRMRRLPDQPHRIARGVFAGTFVNFPPLYGVQMLSAAGLAWLLRGNILAALLATFLSNPLTTPFIAMGSIKLGHWMLGMDVKLTFEFVVAAFAEAGVQLWYNFCAMFTGDVAHWDKLVDFFWFLFWPYTIGSIIPGILFSFLTYYLTIPAVHAYQKLRASKSKERAEKRSALRARLNAVRLGSKSATSGDDDSPGAP
jgi:uncharacterized protein (DUF2062 family)